MLVATAAQAQPAEWFAASPCSAQPADVVALPGTQAWLRVHDQPGAAAHDALLLLGADSVWRAPVDEWAAWTKRPPPSIETTADGTRWVPLNAAPGLALRLDACTAELWVDADPDRVQRTRLTRPVSAPVAVAGHGGFLNVDAEYGGLAGRNVVDGLFDAGVFVPGGSGRSGFFVGTGRVRRLDSTWLRDDPGSALRLRLGDSVTRSADWESAVRFGGVQWGTDFSLQPDRITYPLPAIGGRAALASTAQLYVNGIQQSQQAVQPGGFRFESVPTLTGAGELSVVIRDALGREQTVTQPFYASPRLLAAGLGSDTYEAGFLRENYAGDNDRYTRPFAAATLQRGLDDHLTALLRGAASQQRQLAGGEADWLLAPFGVVTVSAAAARTEAGWGGVTTLAFERSSDFLSLTLRRRIATRDYGDLGREPGTLHFSDAVRVALNLHQGGTASAVYISEQPWTGQGARLAGLAYSVSLSQRVQAYASWLHPLAGSGGDSLVVGFSAVLGRGTSSGVQWGRDGNSSGASGYFQHSPAGPLGWSYYGSADGRRLGVREAGASWACAHGTLGAGYAGFGDHGAPSALMRTGFAVLDGHAYWTRPVNDSFAVVEAGGMPGVRVYRENQLVGSTDSSGRLLVPGLLPFGINRLSIDDRDLPLGLGLASDSAQIAPPASAGVPVRFIVAPETAMPFRLIDADGIPVPAGAPLWLDGAALSLPVGYGGLVYASATPGRHRLQALAGGRRCEALVQVDGLNARPEACVWSGS